MMMKMHHHHIELDGRSGGLIVARLQPRAHPSTEEVFIRALICHGRPSIRPIRCRRPPRLYFVMQKMRRDHYVILAGRFLLLSCDFRRPIAAPHFELRASLRLGFGLPVTGLPKKVGEHR